MNHAPGYYARRKLAALLLDALIPQSERPELRDVMPEDDLPSLEHEDAPTEEISRENAAEVLKRLSQAPEDRLQ